MDECALTVTSQTWAAFLHFCSIVNNSCSRVALIETQPWSEDDYLSSPLNWSVLGSREWSERELET